MISYNIVPQNTFKINSKRPAPKKVQVCIIIWICGGHSQIAGPTDKLMAFV